MFRLKRMKRMRHMRRIEFFFPLSSFFFAFFSSCNSLQFLFLTHTHKCHKCQGKGKKDVSSSVPLPISDRSHVTKSKRNRQTNGKTKIQTMRQQSHSYDEKERKKEEENNLYPGYTAFLVLSLSPKMSRFLHTGQVGETLCHSRMHPE